MDIKPRAFSKTKFVHLVTVSIFMFKTCGYPIWSYCIPATTVAKKYHSLHGDQDNNRIIWNSSIKDGKIGESRNEDYTEREKALL